MNAEEKKQFLSELDQFYGTEHYYRHPFNILLTDGVKFVAEKCGAYWLTDIIASYQSDERVSKEEFQVYILTVNPDQSGRVTIEDGNHNVIEYQDLDYTDFPLETFTIWFTNNVALLPSEY